MIALSAVLAVLIFGMVLMLLWASLLRECADHDGLVQRRVF